MCGDVTIMRVSWLSWQLHVGRDSISPLLHCNFTHNTRCVAKPMCKWSGYCLSWQGQHSSFLVQTLPLYSYVHILTHLTSVKKNWSIRFNQKFQYGFLAPYNNIILLVINGVISIKITHIEDVQSAGWLDIDSTLGSFLRESLATCREKCCSAAETASAHCLFLSLIINQI
jgi:hypothetical protein